MPHVSVQIEKVLMATNYEYDFVVVGSGTGLAAALTAKDEGLNVLVIEKDKFVGGNTGLSGGGFWIPTNSVLREAGMKDSYERAREYITHAVAGETDEARWGTHLRNGPAAVDLLRRMTPLTFNPMQEYSDYFPELPGGSAMGRAVEPKPFNSRVLGKEQARLRPPGVKAPIPMPVTGKSFRWMNLMMRHPRGIYEAGRQAIQGIGGLAIGREYISGGGALAAGLYKGALDAGIPIWFETELTGLIMDSDRCIGIKARRDGQDIEIKASRGVLLSAGGFEHNEEMRHKYQSEKINGDWSFGAPGNKGDAINIAVNDAGADLAFMEEAWWFPAMPLPEGPSFTLAERSLPNQIIVNSDGERFMNEAVNYMTAGQIMLKQEFPLWMIMDQQFKNRYIVGGTVMPRMPFPKEWYEAGVVHKAKSIDELGRKIGLEKLPKTVGRFNLLAASGRDDDFGRGDSAYDRYYGDITVRPNPCLGTIQKGPFYALKIVPGDLGTCGGIAADGSARALREDGSVIEGLYAAGNAAGNVFGRVYPGPGATIGQGLVYGYTAARHAAGKTA